MIEDGAVSWNDQHKLGSDRTQVIGMEMRHEVYIANRPALVAYATRIIRSREAAEDIVQDAFLRLAPAQTDATSHGQMLSYLYRIVRNLSLDFLKRQRVEARETEPPHWSLPHEVPTPEDVVAVGDEIRLISQVLGELPGEVRAALEMHRFGGYTLEEIAARLDISVATAHRHVKLAMLRVATALSANAP